MADRRRTIGVGMCDENSIYPPQSILGEPFDCGCLKTLADIDDVGPVRVCRSQLPCSARHRRQRSLTSFLHRSLGREARQTYFAEHRCGGDQPWSSGLEQTIGTHANILLALWIQGRSTRLARGSLWRCRQAVDMRNGGRGAGSEEYELHGLIAEGAVDLEGAHG